MNTPDAKPKRPALKLPYPISANRYWRHSGSITHVSSEAKAYKRVVALAAKYAGVTPCSGVVAVDITFHPKTTKSGAANKQRLDLDNVLKVTLDALQGVAYQNDSQVNYITADVGQAIDGGGLSVQVRSVSDVFAELDKTMTGKA